MTRACAAAFALCFAFMPLAAPADEAPPEGRVKIQEVVSPGGIEAWLVEEKSIPVVSVEIAFDAGSRFDPPGKNGTAGLMSALFDEGAGDMDERAFKAALSGHAIQMSFGADRDSVSGSLLTLSPYTEEAFRLFSLALTEPRFERSAIERVRGQILVMLQQQESDPSSIASKAWYASALAGHPYALPVYGSRESVLKLTRDDIVRHYRGNLGRDRLHIAVVGDIDAATLGPLLDETFGKLPALGAAPAAPELSVAGAASPTLIDRDIPQSVVIFGGNGIKIDDPDFMPGYVMNYILGGGGFSSRLMDEIREKRGLTYGISTGLSSFEAGGLFVGSFSTQNAAYGEAYSVLISELQRMAEGGVTDKELQDAKTYLTGSFALRFDSNDKIAGQLLGYQVLGYDKDYINRRNDLVRAVTREDVARVARRLLKPSEMLFVVVGKPEGLNATSAGQGASGG